MPVLAPTTVPSLPVWPNLDDAETVFDTKADAVGTAMPGTVTAINAIALNMLNNAQYVEAQATTGLASSNFKGNWSSLTGALNMPASVYHAGVYWQLTANLANVTTATPGVSGSWLSLQQGSNRNVIINGGFTINQRGYVSAAALAAGFAGHDRWKAGASGGDYSFTQLNSDTTITIAANKTLMQVVEDKNVQGTAYVVSWTGTALGRVGVNSATPSGSYAASPILITGQTAGTTLSVEFGNGASAGTLGKVQLERGAVATAFEQRLFSEELRLCQRYLEYTGMVFVVNVASQGYPTAYWKVTKRAAPTLTIVSTAGSGAVVGNSGADPTSGVYQTANNSVDTSAQVSGSAEL